MGDSLSYLDKRVLLFTRKFKNDKISTQAVLLNILQPA